MQNGVGSHRDSVEGVKFRRSWSDASGRDEMFPPVAFVEPVDAYVFSAGGRMDETAVADVDTDVGKFSSFLVEEHQVADAQRMRGDGRTGFQL